MLVSREIRERLEAEKRKLVNDERAKRQLLSSKSDWSMLEKFIQQINLQPDLKVEVHLNDGTVIYLRCYDDNENKINANDVQPVFEDDPQIKIRHVSKH